MTTASSSSDEMRLTTQAASLRFDEDAIGLEAEDDGIAHGFDSVLQVEEDFC